VFPLKKIDGERYLDGGYFDNLPIDMAIADGADEIIAVDIHPQPTHPEYARMPFLKMIHPLHNLGGFLDFNPQLLKRTKLMGYYDTMKAYGRFDGVRYTFTHQSEIKTSPQAREFMRRIAAFDAEAITRTAFKSSQETNAPLISALEAETPLKKLSWKEVWLRGLELAAKVMGFREDAIYDPAVLTGRILGYVNAYAGPCDERSLQVAARTDGRVLLSCIFRALEGPEPPLALLAEWPVHTAAAMYLHCVREN
jgi:hypothetical protein